MSRVRTTALFSLFLIAGCASAPEAKAPAAADAEIIEHPDARTCCGSPESDLFGCTSDHCCARTGIDCGDPHCICKPLVVTSPEGDKK